MQLTLEEINFILTSLEFTKRKFESVGIAPWGDYPSYEFKRERIAKVESIVIKLREMRKEIENEN